MAIDRRLLEYALKGLEAERDRITYEIEELRARLGGRIARRKRQRATAAIRREISETTGQVTKVLKKTVSKKGRRKKAKAAKSPALSEAMKKVWAKRKAAAKS
jgi:hypothetical protein